MLKRKKVTRTISIYHKTVIDGIEIDAEIKVTGTLVPAVYATREQPSEVEYFDEIDFKAVNFHSDYLDAVLDEISNLKGIPIDYYASDMLLEQP